jgi:3-hydroxybutyryl-CoA dehydrogenase
LAVEFRKLGVVGGGFMGRSIAQKVASTGIDVVVLEQSDALAAAARDELDASLDAEIAKWGITAAERRALLARVRFTATLDDLADADMVIETVTEDLARKQEVMRRLGAACPPDRIFITNTSTLSITEIASASGRPDRVVGMHFMYPVPQSPIVEVVRGAETSDAAFATALELARALNKTVIEVFESPGYVVTRAMIPFLNEAMYLVLEGVASAGNVDRAIRLGYQFKMGPLEYADRVGLDKVLGWMEHLWRELGDFKYRPCPLLRKHVRAGHLGRKTGRGFFQWENGERVEARAAEEPTS